MNVVSLQADAPFALPDIPQCWAVVQLEHRGDQLAPADWVTDWVSFHNTLEEAEAEVARACERSRYAAAVILRTVSIHTRIERRNLP